VIVDTSALIAILRDEPEATNSCRNRHCPKCQGAAREAWLAARQAELLPVPYFHVVFTVPAELAEIALHNKTVVYAILFRSAAETLCTIAADRRHLGAEIGVLAVLHSWGQTLTHHPHIHCLVPGGGLSLEPAPAKATGKRWVPCRPGFFLPVRILSRLFRRLFLTALQDAFAADRLALRGILAPLAEPAAFRRRLAAAGHHDWRMTLDAAEFIRRFLLHTLPDGFHRIRYYGFLANRQRAANLALCRRLLAQPEPTADADRPAPQTTAPPRDICPDCGGRMLPLAPFPPAPFRFDSS
jgi:hypothetical protein